MAQTPDAAVGPAPPAAQLAARRCERLKERAERWARLCNELSAHAADLKNLRDELRPQASEAAERERRYEERLGQLEQREAELGRRWKALERGVAEFVRRRKELTAWQMELDRRQEGARDQHVLRAAELELKAEQHLASATASAKQLETVDDELSDTLRQLELERQKFDAEMDELLAEECAS